MPTHVHLVAKPLCDGLCDQESSERRASCRTEGLAIYLLCRPNVGRSGTSPALAPKDHCPDKQGGAKWHFFAPPPTPKTTVRIDKEGEVPLRPTNIPSYPVCTESTAKRAKCPSALQTSRPTPPEGTAKRAKCHILSEQQPEKAIQASSGKNSTEEYACEVCPSGVADFGGVLPMCVAGVEPVRI